MSWQRIKAILIEEIFITKRSMEVLVDLPFFSIISVIVFGFFTKFLTGDVHTAEAQYLLLGIVLWEVVRITQYAMSVSSLWNIWSRCLSSMFVTPLSMTEYIVAQMLSGIIKTSVIMAVLFWLAQALFGLPLWSLGWLNLLLWYANLILFSWSTGLLILGFIFRYGTRIQAMAWGLIFLFQPLTAAFFPVSVLPTWLQYVSYTLPPTYIFESARAALSHPGTVQWGMMGIAALENVVYFVVAIILFRMYYRHSRVTGQFARNEG